MTFNNAKQAIPERFLEKIEVDRKIAEVKAEHLYRDGNIVYVTDIKQYRDKIKPFKEHQHALRISCENFIKDQKARGPTT